MAKLTLQSLISGLASISKLNANFTAIASEFQNKVLYRDNPDGEPNQMECDLDLNQNSISNVNSLTVQALTLQGSPLVYEDMAVLAYEEDYTFDMAGAVGDGVTDDTTAIQSAIDLCKATGRRLRAGNKVYAVTTLTLTISSTDKGPFLLEGHGGPQNFSATLGTQLVQIAGTTGSLLTIQADFDAGDYLTNLGIQNLGLRTSSACTGWAIDARNVTTSGNYIRNVNVYTPGSSCAGGIRLNSCWSLTLDNVTCTGPAAGTTSRGIVAYGSQTSGGDTRGTSNQMVFINVRANYYAKCNVQIGKWDSSDNTGEGTGGFMHSFLWLGGQAGSSSSGYGIVFGRVLDVRVICVHTENNYKSGWYFDDDTNGTDCGDITTIGCDSYNDGDDGVYSDAADRYGVQINRGTNIKLDGFRFQMTRFGAYVSSSADVNNVVLDRIRFTAHTSGGEMALKLQSTTASSTQRIRLGDFIFGGTWTNKIVNGAAASSMASTSSGTNATSANFITVDPDQSTAIVVDGSAATLNGILASDGRTFPNGKVLKLIFGSANTTLADKVTGGTATFKLLDTRNFTPGTGDSVTVCYNSGEWWETDRQYRDSSVHGVSTHTTGTTVNVTNLTKTVTIDPSGALSVIQFAPTDNNKGPTEGQIIQVLFADTNTTLKDNSQDGTSYLYLEDNRNFNGNTQDVVQLMYRSGYWYEINRKYNGNPTTHNTVTHTSGGTITVTNLTRYIVTNLGSATDITDLVAASGRGMITGQVINIKNADAASGNPTFKDTSTTGNFRLAASSDLTLGVTDTLQVQYDGTYWVRTGGSDN